MDILKFLSLSSLIVSHNNSDEEILKSYNFIHVCSECQSDYSPLFEGSQLVSVSNFSQFQKSIQIFSVFDTMAPLIINMYITFPREIGYSLSQLRTFAKRNRHRWNHYLIFYLTSDREDLLNFLDENLWIPFRDFLRIDTQVYLLGAKNNSHFAYEIYFLKNSINIKPLQRKDETGKATTSLIKRRGDFNGNVIKGVTQEDSSLSLIAQFAYDLNGKLKFQGGVSANYFQLMAFGLNFSIEAVRGKGWITQSPNGTLLGMAQQLNSGEADILIAYSEFLPYRLKQLKLLIPYYNGLVRAYFRQPPPNKIRNVFFHPLKPMLWVALLLLWIFIILSLRVSFLIVQHIYLSRRANIYSFFHYSKKIYRSFELEEFGLREEEAICICSNPMESNEKIAQDSVMWGISSACGKGWHILPQSGAMKLIMLSGLLTFMFSFTAYSAAIVTSLSVVLSPIKSWKQLNDSSSGYKVYGDKMLQSSSSVARSVRRHSSGDAKDFSISNETNALPMLEVGEALKLFTNNKPVAIISVRDQFYQVAVKSNVSTEFLCESVSHVPIPGWFVKGGMIISKDSPFQNFFNYITIKIQERGLDSRLGQTYQLDYTPRCHSMNNLGTYTLGINDVFTAFGILLFAHFSSALIVIVEVGYYQRRRKGK